VKFNFNKDGLSCNRLREPGRAFVERQDVGISVFFQRSWASGMLGIIPGARSDHHHTRKQVVDHPHSGESRPAIIENPDDVAILQPARLGIGAPDLERLATFYFRLAALGRWIKLAV
jgi:hypothetical protein